MREEKQFFGRRVALVTGGSRGIGRCVCVALAKAGFDVCINYAGSKQAALQTLELCQAQGVQAFTVQADVSTAAGCNKLFAALTERFGRVDVLVNNAGITRDGLIIRLDEEDYDQVMDTNLKGAFLCCKAAACMMLRQRYGRIVNMSSVVGLHGNAGQANYSASKAGLIGLTKSLAKELASRSITVNAVAPGFVATDMTRAMPEKAQQAVLEQVPVGRAADPEEIARVVAFLADEHSGYLTGQVIGVDGGMGI